MVHWNAVRERECHTYAPRKKGSKREREKNDDVMEC